MVKIIDLKGVWRVGLSWITENSDNRTLDNRGSTVPSSAGVLQ